jgi:hypothetical protein
MSRSITGSGGSRLWHSAFVVAYRAIRLLDPVIRAAWRRDVPGLGRTIDLVVTGRRSGRRRHTLLTMLSADDTWYIGHPNGDTDWTRNLEAARGAEIRASDGSANAVTGLRLRDGPERSSVVALTASQQPFPANILYSLAGAHIQAVGVYFRLERRRPDSTSATQTA